MAEIKTVAPGANVEPGTENAPQTGLMEPHSPAANALPNAGASGVTHDAVAQSTTSTFAPAVSQPLETDFPVSAERISSSQSDAELAWIEKNRHAGDVKFKVNYAKDFKGKKSLGANGTIQVVSKESAEQFTKLGFGSIVK